MYIDNDIPKIDLPEDWIIGKLTKSEIGLLNLYANYPCRLKAEIFVLCLQGDLEASIDLTRYKVRPGSFITIQPGTIFANISGRRRFWKSTSWDFLQILSVNRTLTKWQ